MRSGLSKRPIGWAAAVLAVLLVLAGCAGITPYEPRNHREEGPQKGLFSGAKGEFEILRLEAPPKDSQARPSADDAQNSPRQTLDGQAEQEPGAALDDKAP